VSATAELPITSAGGAGENHSEFGTDAADILEAIERVYSEEGVLVLSDLGSAVISSRLAIELMNAEKAKKVILCSAPLVEGAVGAAVQIASGASVEEAKEEALNGLIAKQSEIGDVEIN
jgi:phosphocarrier protein FPr